MDLNRPHEPSGRQDYGFPFPFILLLSLFFWSWCFQICSPFSPCILYRPSQKSTFFVSLFLVLLPDAGLCVRNHGGWGFRIFIVILCHYAYGCLVKVCTSRRFPLSILVIFVPGLTLSSPGGLFNSFLLLSSRPMLLLYWAIPRLLLFSCYNQLVFLAASSACSYSLVTLSLGDFRLASSEAVRPVHLSVLLVLRFPLWFLWPVLQLRKCHF